MESGNVKWVAELLIPEANPVHIYFAQPVQPHCFSFEADVTDSDPANPSGLTYHTLMVHENLLTTSEVPVTSDLPLNHPSKHRLDQGASPKSHHYYH